MRKFLVIAVVIVVAFVFLITSVVAYNLLGGRWSDSSIGNLGIYVNPYNNPEYDEMLAAEDSWDDTQTPLSSYVTTYQWQAKVFFMLVDEDGVGWDGMATLYPSPTSDPYTQAQTRLNLFYTQGYSFEKTQSVQAHEFGHVLGLDHETGAVLMNGNSYSRYDVYGVYTPQQDDVNGVNDIYG